MKRLLVTGTLLLGTLMAFGATAAEMSEAEQQAKAVADRQAVFKLLGVSMGPLGGMARGADYDEATALLAAQRIAGLSGMIAELFALDTSSNTGLTTKAQDSIWSAQNDFAGLAADLTAGANQAIEILNSQGANGVRGAVGAIGQKCGACHDRFRLD